MAKGSVRGGSGPKYPKSEGKQGLLKGNDYGAKRMLDETHSPEDVKAFAGGNFVKYKHEEK